MCDCLSTTKDKTMNFVLCWLMGSCLVLNAVYSLPIDDVAIDYLRSYGYLQEPTPIESRFGDDLVKLHEDTATAAVKALQKLGNIEETGVLDDATRELLRKPRCGNPDFEITQRRQKRYTTGPTKWDKHDLTWKFVNRNHPRSQNEYQQIRRLIHEAMSIWEFNSVLKLQEVRSDDADILIDFARGNHGDNFNFNGAGGSLAHAFYPGSGISGDVHMDNDESWDIEDGHGGDVSFFYTLLHELGHSLGLAHSSTTESIMYPWYSSARTFDRSTKELYDDDRIGIAEIYGGKRSWGPRTPPRTTLTTSTERLTPTRGPTTTHAPPPDMCNTSYDAIGVIRNELMIFKGVWMWRFRDNRLLQGYPVEFARMWPELQRFSHIDAVFERVDGKFAFFIDQEVIVIDSYQKAYTHNLEYLGLSRSVKKIDAIFRWGHNNKTYIFSGDDFWRVDDNLHVAEVEMRSYPKKIYTNWKRVKSIQLDTAMQLDGVTYFFSGRTYYKFDDFKMTLEVNKPRVSSERWMHCVHTEEEIESIQKLARIQNETSSAPTIDSTTVSVFKLLLLSLASFFLFKKF